MHAPFQCRCSSWPALVHFASFKQHTSGEAQDRVFIRAGVHVQAAEVHAVKACHEPAQVRRSEPRLHQEAGRAERAFTVPAPATTTTTLLLYRWIWSLSYHVG